MQPLKPTDRKAFADVLRRLADQFERHGVTGQADMKSEPADSFVDSRTGFRVYVPPYRQSVQIEFTMSVPGQKTDTGFVGWENVHAGDGRD